MYGERRVYKSDSNNGTVRKETRDVRMEEKQKLDDMENTIVTGYVRSGRNAKMKERRNEA